MPLTHDIGVRIPYPLQKALIISAFIFFIYFSGDCGLLVKIVDKIGVVFVYWSKLVDKYGCLPAFSTCIELEILIYKELTIPL